jgi:ankyrin repeat protein
MDEQYLVALKSAIASGDTQFVKDAIDLGMLAIVSKFGQIDIARFLLDNGADVNADDGQALTFASKAGHAEMVQLLIDYGADVNANESDPIIWACIRGKEEVVRILVENGANVNVEIPVNNEDGTYGGKYTPIVYASREGHANIVKFLIEKGVDIHVNNEVALSMAINGDYPRIVELLVDNGADFSNIKEKPNNYEKYLEKYNKYVESFKNEIKDARKLRLYSEQFCETYVNNKKLNEIKIIAKKLNIDTKSKNKEELCSEILMQIYLHSVQGAPLIKD